VKRIAATLLGITVALSGCSTTQSAKGQVADGSETFTGSATAHGSHRGSIKLTSSRGRLCTGNFEYVSDQEGKGMFNCSDLESGPFTFVSTGGMHGTGSGTLGGKPFTFTVG
jgi:hypothetical protein